MIHFDGDLSLLNVFDGDLSLIESLDGECGTYQKVYEADVYTGATEVEPSEETQILQTASKMVGENITIHPIPQNYGRIAWNGSNLIVF